MEKTSGLDFSKLDLGSYESIDIKAVHHNAQENGISRDWRNCVNHDKDALRKMLDTCILRNEIPSMSPEVMKIYEDRKRALKKEGKL